MCLIAVIRIDPAGIPFVSCVWVPAAILLVFKQVIMSLPLVIIGCVFLFFFRDPDRRTPLDPQAIISPADGQVMYVGDADESLTVSGEWYQVSIFLSPLNVHVNRIPIGGRITRVKYRKGQFWPAYKKKASVENEATEVWIDHEGQTVICRQIVGILARRIVCRLSAGTEVQTGQRFGIMKFGSRMDVFMPRSAALKIATGETVRGGETVLAILEETTRIKELRS